MQNALSQYRDAHQLTVAAAAKRLGVAKSTWWKWENNRVPAERVVEVSRATGVPCSAIRPEMYSDEAVA